jgi:hypothetical protein
MTDIPKIQMHASRSFYEAVIRIAAILFAIAIYMLLLKFSIFNVFILLLIIFGLVAYAFLCRKKHVLELTNKKMITLDRSYIHILTDIINETCRTALFSVSAFIIINRKFNVLDDDFSLTREAIVIATIVLAYIYVLWFYQWKSREEQ